MFIGHFAAGYAAKRWAPRLSLAVLFAAAQLADLLWPLLVAAGVEQVRIAPGFTAATPLEFISYPYSHSLVMLALWGTLLGWVVTRTSAPRKRIAIIILALVVSHWVLDFVSHIPDMPLYPGGPKVGLGLWNSVAGTKVVEVTMFGAGVWIYMRHTRARDRIGRWGTWGLVGFLLIGFLMSGAPPPSVTALWIAALVLGGLTLWLAWWTDRHRVEARI